MRLLLWRRRRTPRWARLRWPSPATSEAGARGGSDGRPQAVRGRLGLSPSCRSAFRQCQSPDRRARPPAQSLIISDAHLHAALQLRSILASDSSSQVSDFLWLLHPAHAHACPSPPLPQMMARASAEGPEWFLRGIRRFPFARVVGAPAALPGAVAAVEAWCGSVRGNTKGGTAAGGAAGGVEEEGEGEEEEGIRGRMERGGGEGAYMAVLAVTMHPPALPASDSAGGEGSGRAEPTDGGRREGTDATAAAAAAGDSSSSGGRGGAAAAGPAWAPADGRRWFVTHETQRSMTRAKNSVAIAAAVQLGLVEAAVEALQRQQQYEGVVPDDDATNADVGVVGKSAER